MAPEQAEGKPVDQRADVFSFGVVLYEMLSGVQPFRRDSVSGTLAAILRDEPPALDATRVPPAIRQVIQCALQKNPEARYTSGAELVSALAPDSVPAARRVTPNMRRLVAGAAAAVVVAAGLGGWNVYKQSRVDWARSEGLPDIARLLAEGQGRRRSTWPSKSERSSRAIPISSRRGPKRDPSLWWKPIPREPRSTFGNSEPARNRGGTSEPRRSGIRRCPAVTSSGRL
jgi:serine/threonine protein kinase